MLGYDNYATRFESIMSPMGNIQGGYGMAGGYGMGYGAGYGMGYPGVIIDPLMDRRTVDGVVAADATRSNYYTRPIPKHPHHDDIPMMLGIGATALGATALAIAALKSRSAGKALKNAQKEAEAAKKAAEAAEKAAASAGSAAGVGGANPVNGVLLTEGIPLANAGKPYVNPLKEQVLAGLDKPHTVVNRPSVTQAVENAIPFGTPRHQGSGLIPNGASVIPGTQAHQIQATPAVPGGFSGAQPAVSHTNVVPGVTTPVSNINPAILARRANTATPSVPGGFTGAQASTNYASVVPGQADAVSNVNPNLNNILSRRREVIAQRQAQNLAATPAVPGGSVNAQPAASYTSAVTRDMNRPGNINPAILERRNLASTPATSGGFVGAQSENTLANVVTRDMNRPGSINPAILERRSHASTPSVPGGFSGAQAANTYSSVVPGVSTPVTNINPAILAKREAAFIRPQITRKNNRFAELNGTKLQTIAAPYQMGVDTQALAKLSPAQRRHFNSVMLSGNGTQIKNLSMSPEYENVFTALV